MSRTRDSLVYVALVAIVATGVSVVTAQQEQTPEQKKAAQVEKRREEAKARRKAERANDPNLVTYMSPTEAGRDYELQGEYVGSFAEDGKTEVVGIQVIALGDGKFRAVGYEGGLPGAGADMEHRETAEGTFKDGEVRFENDEGVSVLTSGGMTIYSPDGKTVVGQAKKSLRESPTLGLEPPPGAVVLFDTENAEESLKNWDGAKIVEGKYLGVGEVSKEEFGDHTLHLEFFLPFMPRATGQKRSNSGVYVQGRFEVQVLDSFGLEGVDNECGGIYKVSGPSVNMCLPPLTWQTYDIDIKSAKFDGDKQVKPARITVRHNGVVIHDNAALEEHTPGGKKTAGPGPGPLYLQDHTDPVMYRNVWVLPQ